MSKKLTENPNLAPNRKVVRYQKTTVTFSPKSDHKKSTEIFIPLKHIKFKVISYIQKKQHKLLKILTIAAMKLSLLEFCNILKKMQPEVPEHCLYLAASTFTLFCFTLRIF